MPCDHWMRRCRQWYGVLLRLYPAPHRARFGQGMAQLFNDLLRERAAAGGSPMRLALTLFVEAFIALLRARLSAAVQHPAFMRPAIGTTLILLIPLVMTFVDRGLAPGEGWHWEPNDFAAMGSLLFVAGVSFELLARRTSNTLRRVALGTGIAVLVLAVWAELAVHAMSQLFRAIAG